MSFETALAFVLLAEGGDKIVDNPRDPGGLTKWGISQRAYPNLNIRELTGVQAADIYLKDYWSKCRCSELPAPIAFILFDSAVNQGVHEAIMLLQKSLDIPSDGIIGPITITEAKIAYIQHHDVVTEFVSQRAFHYGMTPKFEYFGLGWMRRLAKVHELALQQV